MLTIRSHQMKTLEQSALRQFEDDMAKRLKKFAPLHLEVIGEEGARKVIRLGIERADGYGMNNRGPVRFYIEQMFMFGSDFDTDPQVPWAGWFLNGAWISDQMERAQLLFEKTRHYLDMVAGQDSQYAISALRRLRQASAGDFPQQGGNIPDQLLSAMKWAYPEKCEYLGDPPLQALVKQSMDKARKYGLSDDKGIALFVVLAFAMGHGFDNDPLFPWVSKTVNDMRFADSNQRADKLQDKALVYLKRVLDNLEKR